MNKVIFNNNNHVIMGTVFPPVLTDLLKKNRDNIEKKAAVVPEP